MQGKEGKKIRDVAIVKVDYAKSRGAAKANIRYIEHRRGRDNAKITRTLFGSYGQMGREQAYGIIDQAEAGSRFFRIKISPDPSIEDAKRDLLLREITEHIMDTLEKHIGKPVAWVGAVHDDHTPLRHVHALAIVRERLLPVQLMRQSATEACLAQRKERDLGREQQERREQEGGEWERER